MGKTIKKKTKKQFISKLLKFLLIAYTIVIIVWIILDKYVNDKRPIEQKIGSMSLASISIKDALNIKGYAILPYADFVKAGDTKAAYNMLTEEYKAAVSYDDYLKTIEGIDFNTFDMKEIKLKAEGTYVATVVYEKNGEPKETDYLLYLNEVNPQIITISPNKFIYNYSNLEFKMDGIELILQECNIYTDHIEMTALIKNTSWFDTMKFANIGVGYNDNVSKMGSVDFSLEPGEIKEIDISYESEYYVPNNIKIKRNIDNETLRTYTFYFKDGK